MFYDKQPKNEQQLYQKFLKAASKLSVLTSKNNKPDLDPRLAEGIFCKSFSAEDVSRSDVSVDAVKEKEGVGIKTFLTKTNCIEKVAEFNNRAKYPLSTNSKIETVKQIADYRNKRILDTIKKYDLRNCYYHYVVRDVEKFYICETQMPVVDIDSIELNETKNTDHIIRFKDAYNLYQFHTTKNTLYMNFPTSFKYETIDLKGGNSQELIAYLVEAFSDPNKLNELKKELVGNDFVVLPLYSTRTGEVSAKSGLNQWRAEGRPRDPNEVYIPIPRAVHEIKKGFFPERNKHFLLKTSDGKEFKAKVCQENDKALMTDPNKDLGEWLLRSVLKIPVGKEVKYEDLRRNRADSVIITKINSGEYKISLHSFGAYEKFKDAEVKYDSVPDLKKAAENHLN